LTEDVTDVKCNYRIRNKIYHIGTLLNF